MKKSDPISEIALIKAKIDYYSAIFFLTFQILPAP